MKISES